MMFLGLSSGQKPKILCLHGGGGTALSMESTMRDIEDALPEYEFVFADAAYGDGDSRLWIRDPPGGKGQPTTDPGFADASIQALDAVVDAEGPFFGILGYSQGAAFVPVYLSRVPVGTFQVGEILCVSFFLLSLSIS
jgi:pimeloyl-ACP methyl ester carboxylesterase